MLHSLKSSLYTMSSLYSSWQFDYYIQHHVNHVTSANFLNISALQIHLTFNYATTKCNASKEKKRVKCKNITMQQKSAITHAHTQIHASTDIQGTTQHIYTAADEEAICCTFSHHLLVLLVLISVDSCKHL